MGPRVKRNGSGGEAKTPGGPLARLTQSRLAVAVMLPQTSKFPGHALTAASTARGFRGRDGWSRQRRQDVILDRAVKDRYGKHRITLYPVGHEGPYPDSSCTGESKAQNRRDPSERTGSFIPWVTPVTRLSWFTSAVIARGRLQARAHDSAGGDETSREVAPQRHHQLARERHDRDPARSSLEVAHPLVEPAGQFTFGLMLDPEPGKLDGDRASAGIAGFADPLVALGYAAVVRRSGQSEIAPDLPTIVERAIERLIDQLLSADHRDTLQVSKHYGLGLRRTRFSGAQLGTARGLNIIDLPDHHRKPFVFAHDLRLKAFGQRTTIAGAQLIEARDKSSPKRHCITDTLGMKQPLDAVRVCRLLPLEILALAIEPLAILIFHRRHVHHAADPRFVSQIGKQRAQELIEVDAVRLDAPSQRCNQCASKPAS